MFSGIRALVFDLDGTLYTAQGFAREVYRAACAYAAGLTGTSQEAAESLVGAVKERLSRERGMEATLSSVCMELGGDVEGFHKAITPMVHPEEFLVRDELVVNLVRNLANRFDLYVYTNNNRILTDRILGILGLSDLFRRVFTIEDFHRPKPDRDVLEKLFTAIGRSPEECLFVGDRYDVDLRIPADMGSAVFLVKGVQELLALALTNGETDC